MALDAELVAKVKEYNARLKNLNNEKNQLEAKVEYSKKEFNRICGELTQELGKEVNADNVEELYDEMIKRIKENVEVGNQIMDRAEMQLRGVQAQQAPQVQAVQPQMPVQPVQQAMPVNNGYVQQPQAVNNDVMAGLAAGFAGVAGANGVTGIVDNGMQNNGMNNAFRNLNI